MTRHPISGFARRVDDVDAQKTERSVWPDEDGSGRMIITDVYQHDEPQVAVTSNDEIDAYVKQRPPILA